MQTLNRWTRSLLKRLPGGPQYLQKRMIYKKYLFKPCSKEIYSGLHGHKKEADAVYLEAFDRIFLLISAFYSNGLRGDIYEFGVMNGYTAALLADCMLRFNLQQSQLQLFDSFDGLPEMSEVDRDNYEYQNGQWDKGALKTPQGLEVFLKQELQKKLGLQRVHAFKGYFENTLEKVIATKKLSKALLINLDCDLHSSSKFVLQTLLEHDLIQDGTVLICDDWMTSFGNPNLGQRRAVQEILECYPQWSLEPYMNYGLGSQVFVMHNLSITKGKKLDEDKSVYSHPAQCAS
ncbi:MAG: hypothetical protein S4CHLAM123_13200 [Chlamydiales bacterium]|nr:hypothetical protein [Chlamydiales bacterium]